MTNPSDDDQRDAEGADWVLRRITMKFSEVAAKERSQRVKRGIAEARARRLIEPARLARKPCKYCSGRGWHAHEAGIDASQS
jgi:hypothetical protein